MALADSKYWNLAQVAAWVMYREMELVVQFEHPSRTGFMALGMLSINQAIWIFLKRHLNERRLGGVYVSSASAHPFFTLSSISLSAIEVAIFLE